MVKSVKAGRMMSVSEMLSRVTGLRRLSSSGINVTNLQIQRTSTPRTKLPNQQLLFGNSFTDHMLEIDWDAQQGWHAPLISPYHGITLDPACSALHYALQAFEGMKAYIDGDGKIRLFRPDMNMKRLNLSCQRLQFPTFDNDQHLDCIKELLKVEKEWIPQEEGYSLYIRPTIISTHPFLGVGPAKQVKMFTILSPVGPYYREGFAAVTLMADDKYVRAWPGGSGDSKIGANYGPTIMPQMRAADAGYTQILWLYGEEQYVTEVGTMNQFFLWKTKSGETELITAPLDGTILPGVTRDSILQLCREWGEFTVSERPYTISDVIEAADDGRIIEAFGSGTAAIVSPVKAIAYKGIEYSIPLDPTDSSSQAGPLTKRLAEEIMAIQYGKRPDHPWSVVVD